MALILFFIALGSASWLHNYFWHAEPLTDSILHRIPAMEKAEIRQMINGPESFTPDMHALLGEAPEVSHYCSTYHN